MASAIMGVLSNIYTSITDDGYRGGLEGIIPPERIIRNKLVPPGDAYVVVRKSDLPELGVDIQRVSREFPRPPRPTVVWSGMTATFGDVRPIIEEDNNAHEDVPLIEDGQNAHELLEPPNFNGNMNLEPIVIEEIHPRPVTLVSAYFSDLSRGINNIGIFISENTDSREDTINMITSTSHSGSIRLVADRDVEFARILNPGISELMSLPKLRLKSMSGILQFLSEKALDDDGYIIWNNGNVTRVNIFTGSYYNAIPRFMMPEMKEINIRTIMFASGSFQVLEKREGSEAIYIEGKPVDKTKQVISCKIYGLPKNLTETVTHIKSLCYTHEWKPFYEIECEAGGKSIDLNPIWNEFPSLDIFSYEIKSTVVEKKILLQGKVVLPLSIGAYQEGNDIKFTSSNGTFYPLAMLDTEIFDVWEDCVIHTECFGEFTTTRSGKKTKLGKPLHVPDPEYTNKYFVKSSTFNHATDIGPEGTTGCVVIANVNPRTLQEAFSTGALVVCVIPRRYIPVGDELIDAMYHYGSEGCIFSWVIPQIPRPRNYQLSLRGHGNSFEIWETICETLAITQDHTINEKSLFHYLGVTLYQIADLLSPNVSLKKIGALSRL